MNLIQILFYFLAAVTLGTAVLTVLSRNTVRSAIYIITCFFSIAGHFMMLNAQFLAIIHVIVYTGAIMILLLFTLMLMNLSNDHEPRKRLGVRIGATCSAGLMALVLLAALIRAQPELSAIPAATTDFQSVKVIGQVLMNDYLMPFQFTSIMLVVSMIGAVLVSKREKRHTS